MGECTGCRSCATLDRPLIIRIAACIALCCLLQVRISQISADCSRARLSSDHAFTAVCLGPRWQYRGKNTPVHGSGWVDGISIGESPDLRPVCCQSQCRPHPVISTNHMTMAQCFEARSGHPGHLLLPSVPAAMHTLQQQTPQPEE